MTRTTTARPSNLRVTTDRPDLIVVTADRKGDAYTYVVDRERVTVSPIADTAPPAHVWAIVSVIQSRNPGIGLFLADHNHGETTTEGAWSIAHEGTYEWPTYVTVWARDHAAAPADVHIEPITGWCLGVYLNTDAD